MPSSEFESDTKLIELIKAKPILYDVRHIQYKNNAVKKMVWMQLATEMGISSKYRTLKLKKDCQARWRLLKIRYSSARQQSQCRSGDAPKPTTSKNSFVLTELAFLNQFEDGPTVSSIESCIEINPQPTMALLSEDSSLSSFEEIIDWTTNSMDETIEVNITPQFISPDQPCTPLTSSRKRKRYSQPENPPVLNDLLETLKGHQQILTERTLKPECKCNKIDPFFIALQDEYNKINKKYSLEAKIGLFNTIKEFIDKGNSNED